MRYPADELLRGSMATDSVCRLVSDPIDLSRHDDDNGDDGLEDDQSGSPLPGFDPHSNCRLCRLYATNTGSVVNGRGRNLDAGLLEELVRTFHGVKLTSRPHLIEGYTKKFRELGRTNPSLAFLVDVTGQEVWNHYDEDHDESAHRFRDPMREVERTLQTVLHQAPLTLCMELRKGRNRGKRVIHPGRLRSYLDTVKVYTQLYPRTHKQ